MNKRDYKVSGEGGHFHIFNRGNGLQDIFIDDEDYNFFLFKLKQNIYPDESLKRMRPLPDSSFSLLSYCLMPNHFHLLLRQDKEYPSQQLLLRVCSSYSKYFNRKYKKVGHVFQDRFKQVNIEDDEQLLWIHAYINLNPIIDKYIENYKWSSYREMLGYSNGLCERSFLLHSLKDAVKIKKFFDNALPILRINKKIRKYAFE